MAGESAGKNCGDCDGKIAGKSQRKVGLVYDETMCKHDTPDGEVHVECPDRIRVIWEKLQLSGVTQRCMVLGGTKAEDKHLKLVHTKKHVNLVKNISTKQKDSRRDKIASQLDSIYLSKGSSEAAYLAVGSVVEVAEKVAKGELDSGFAIVRPPGHHAEADEARGFCLFNNVAVAASYLLNQRPDLGIKKILIVDWDIHHGNGTQKMFWKDPRVLVFSVHRHDHGSFYPSGDDGDYNMVGEGPGEGFNVNVPWEQGGCGDADYLAAWDHILIPVAKEFNPEFILVSAGFDAAIGDPLGGCCVTPYGYSVMLKKLMEFAQGKIVLALEGGYNLESMAKSSLACVQVLLKEKPTQCSSGAFPLESTWRVIKAVRKRLCAYWPSLADKLSSKLINQKTRTPVGNLSSCLPSSTVSGARTEGPNLTVRPSLESSYLLPHSHLSVAKKRKAPASGSTSSYRFSEMEDVMVEKVLPSFHEELKGMEFDDRIAFGKESSLKAILMFEHIAQENRELRYKCSAASEALMASNENLKNLNAERNSADALHRREVEELKSLLAARDGELEASRKELKAKKKELETKEKARLMLVRIREDELCGLRAKIESLVQERDEAVVKAERLDKELQDDRLRNRVGNGSHESNEDMDSDKFEPMSQEFNEDTDSEDVESLEDFKKTWERIKENWITSIKNLKQAGVLATIASGITNQYQVYRRWERQGNLLGWELEVAAEKYHKLRALLGKVGQSNVYPSVEVYEKSWNDVLASHRPPVVTREDASSQTVTVSSKRRNRKRVRRNDS
ncbi:PREDICTED: histone deacetylase 18-like [Camelina sativa]|uniref:Histone deacetylase 18-like n=1 Tax=Camelina sativa TaxID=90675 RepID=A0ABM1QJK5_CAMSA|nr:PREDICTED: histone deacetylase 18-like [Camelina sativa]